MRGDFYKGNSFKESVKVIYEKGYDVWCVLWGCGKVVLDGVIKD